MAICTAVSIGCHFASRTWTGTTARRPPVDLFAWSRLQLRRRGERHRSSRNRRNENRGRLDVSPREGQKHHDCGHSSARKYRHAARNPATRLRRSHSIAVHIEVLLTCSYAASWLRHSLHPSIWRSTPAASSDESSRSSQAINLLERHTLHFSANFLIARSTVSPTVDVPFSGPLRFHGNASLPPLAEGTPVRTPSATESRLRDAGTSLSQAPVAPASRRPPKNPFRRRAVR